MTRLLEPSEAYHALLDWHTDFSVEVAATVTPAVAAAGLDRLHATLPGLGHRIVRTDDGFAFGPPQIAPSAETGGGMAQVVATLSRFVVDTTRPGMTVVCGRLHHVLGDVTAILSVIDHLLGLLGIEPAADSIPADAGQEWPIAAERALRRTQSDDEVRPVRLFFSGAETPPLKPAQPVTLHLDAAAVRALDNACAIEDTSLTSVIAIAAARHLVGVEQVVVGAPVDCRVFIDPEQAASTPPRAVGNCSHGALVTVPGTADTPTGVLRAARECDEQLMAALEAGTPCAPFQDSRQYLPENNARAHLVVSNARGAARRLPRLAAAHRIFLLPESSIPALPMIAVNESPASGDIDITVIADPADHAPSEVRAAVDALANTLTEIRERQ